MGRLSAMRTTRTFFFDTRMYTDVRNDTRMYDPQSVRVSVLERTGTVLVVVFFMVFVQFQ